MKNKRAPLSLFVALLPLLSSCGFINPFDNRTKVTSVSLDCSELNIYTTETHQFIASVEPTDATNKGVTYTVSDYTLAGINAESGLFTAIQAGEVTVTVTTKDGHYTDTCLVHITTKPAKVLDHISVTPYKTTYYAGEQISNVDLNVVAHYTDPYFSEEVVIDYTVNGSTQYPGNKTFTVSYQYEGVIKEASYQVTVTNPIVTSLAINTMPSLTDFYVGDVFTYDGLSVKANYTNDTFKVVSISDCQVVAPDMSTSGTKAVVINYEEDGHKVSASYNIHVRRTDGVDYESLYEMIQTNSYDQSHYFEIEGTITCNYSDSYGNNYFYFQSKDDQDNEAAIYVYRYKGTVYDEGSLVRLYGPLSMVKRYYTLAEIDDSSNQLTVTLLESPEDNPYVVDDKVLTASDWDTNIYLYAYSHGPLQISLNRMSISTLNTSNGSLQFSNGTSVSMYFGSSNVTEDIKAKLQTAYDSVKKINVRGYIASNEYNGNQYAQLLIRRVSDIEIIESQDELDVTIVAFNDFHGTIFEDGSSMGLAKIGTYLKLESKKDNTLVLSQGDDWQGSIYSNHNRGAVVNDIYAYSRVSARTVGNHDFDWGVDALKKNTAAGYDNYVTPVLAANVYDYDSQSKTPGNIQQSDIGVPTVTYTLENGLKVGVVGVIGEDQITSITSSYTKDICFINHIQTIKQYATKLRNEEACDIVIATCHTGQEDLLNQSLGDYVDLVLCGHTHQYEIDTVEGNLRYFQFGCNGRYIGNVTLSYNINTGETSFKGSTVINRYNINSYVTSIDSNIQNRIDYYKTQCDTEADEVLASNVSGTFSYNQEAVNVMCKAIYDKAVAEGHGDIILSYSNNARAALPSGSWTYASIYQSFPFDNTVYIELVKGSDILNEVKRYNCVYLNPNFNCIISPSAYYKIAVLDYLLFHTNTSRDYDYFDHFDGNPDSELSLNYRVILREWLKSNGYATGKALKSSDYSSSLSSFDRTRLTSA